MSDPTEHDPPEPEAMDTDASARPSESPADSELRSLLRRALPDKEPEPDLLGAVQKKLRLRSGGKFYADGWSVSKHPPISTYLITGLGMLAVVILLYATLFSFSGTAEKIDPTPAPVQIVPSR